MKRTEPKFKREPKELFKTVDKERAFRTYGGKEKSQVILELAKKNFEITHEDEKFLCIKVEQGSQLFRALCTLRWEQAKQKEKTYLNFGFIKVNGKEIY